MTASRALPECICLTGPTATGKTDLALALAEEHAAEIVSMDSAMVYRGMDVGTAKPDRAARERVPHHLIDIREPPDAYSAGRFAADAADAIADIRARGKLALVVGGTLLYLRALRDGLADLPERDAAVRALIDAEAEDVGWPAMHAKLAALDPAAAARIEPGDRQRIQRALEVHAITGRPLSELQAETAPGLRPQVATIALIPEDRAALGRRIERRFAHMIDAGLVDEVRALMARPGLAASSASMRAVGYRQLWAHLSGVCGWEEAERRAIVATRRLAKRQLTWLRADAGAVSVALEAPALYRRVSALVGRELDR